MWLLLSLLYRFLWFYSTFEMSLKTTDRSEEEKLDSFPASWECPLWLTVYDSTNMDTTDFSYSLRVAARNIFLSLLVFGIPIIIFPYLVSSSPVGPECTGSQWHHKLQATSHSSVGHPCQPVRLTHWEGRRKDKGDQRGEKWIYFKEYMKYKKSKSASGNERWRV